MRDWNGVDCTFESTQQMLPCVVSMKGLTSTWKDWGEGGGRLKFGRWQEKREGGEGGDHCAVFFDEHFVEPLDGIGGLRAREQLQQNWMKMAGKMCACLVAVAVANCILVAIADAWAGVRPFEMSTGSLMMQEGS